MKAKAASRGDPARRCLPPEAWPEGDRLAWNNSLRKGDLLDPGGAASTLTAASLEFLIKAYGRWLTWLVVNKRLDPALAPGDRVTLENIRDYVTELRGVNSSMTVLVRVSQLRQALRAMEPDREFPWLRRIEARLRAIGKPVRNKRARLVPTRELVALGVRLMDKADGAGVGVPIQSALQFRDGLMVALLAARPFRVGNFTSISIGRHLVAQSDGYWLRFEGAETKNGRPIDVPFPAALEPYLERYISDYRPILARNAERAPHEGVPSALWISEAGLPMKAKSVTHFLARRTRDEFGHALNPHLFRDCAATSIAEEDPEHVGIVRIILGHTTHAMGERHYIHAKSFEAGRLYQNEILRLRRQSRDKRGRRRPAPT